MGRLHLSSSVQLEAAPRSVRLGWCAAADGCERLLSSAFDAVRAPYLFLAANLIIGAIALGILRRALQRRLIVARGRNVDRDDRV